VLLAHYIADYPLQIDFLSQTKGKYWYSLFTHSMIYSLSVCLCFKLLGVFIIWKFVVLFISHYIIDYVKSNAKNKDKALTSYLYIDQGLHIMIVILLLLV